MFNISITLGSNNLNGLVVGSIDFQLREEPIEDFLASSNNSEVVFPSIVIHPSVKFKRMKSQ